MHHSDLEFDVTTGSRFHPAEIALSLVIKLVVVGALGAPVLAVLIFEVILNASAMFNHAHVSVPKGVDRVLRWIIVTPDMHRVHHSIISSETNSNFDFNQPWWGHLFGTYTAQPKGGPESMTIGIAQFRHGRDLRIDRMLVQPLLGKAGDYAINRKTPSSKTTKSPLELIQFFKFRENHHVASNPHPHKSFVSSCRCHRSCSKFSREPGHRNPFRRSGPGRHLGAHCVHCIVCHGHSGLPARPIPRVECGAGNVELGQCLTGGPFCHQMLMMAISIFAADPSLETYK